MTSKTIQLGIDQFSVIPTKLSGFTKIPSPISFGTNEIFHHYFISKFGDSINDRKVYEYEQCLTSDSDWRFKGKGIGRDTESKRNASNELAKGFARWFLYTFEGITYFDPLEEQLLRTYPGGEKWKRIEEGDLPDYVCGPDSRTIRLAEVKGRYRSVSFSNQEFASFRKQINRIGLVDQNSNPISVKGYIAACQWATEEQRVKSKLLVEDPSTYGEKREDGEYPVWIGRELVAGHYVPILQRLMLLAHADALRQDIRILTPVGSTLPIWEVVTGPLIGKRFVGGLIPQSNSNLDRSWPYWHPADRVNLFLTLPEIFFGVELSVFEGILSMVTSGRSAADEIPRIDTPEDLPFTMTLLRDGTLMAPHAFMQWTGDRVHL